MYPKLLIIPHEGQHKLQEDFANQVALELWMVLLLHLEDEGILWVLKILLHLFAIVHL